MILDVKKLDIKDVLLIKTDIFNDYRGSFVETYTDEIKNILGVNYEWVQENESISKKNVFRGFHFQKGKFSQSKLLRVSKGSIKDIMIDLRKDSQTFKKHISIDISSRNLLLFIPKGIAHGFLTLSNNSIINYKCDNFYNPNFESGVNLFSDELNIDLNIKKEDIVISDKDRDLPFLNSSYIF